MQKIILASTSPRRRMILEQAGLNFTVMASDFEEDNGLPLPPAELVAHLALGKAQAVARQHPETVVVGADTLIALNGQVMGKQESREAAIATLTALSGRTHSVLTGMAIVRNEQVVTDCVKTDVYFRQLAPSEIEHFVARPENWQGLAGGYNIHDRGALLIEKIDGDYYNVVGLPLVRLVQLLKQFDIDVL